LYIYFVYFSFPPINGREFLGIFLPTNYTGRVDILYFFSLLDRLTNYTGRVEFLGLSISFCKKNQFHRAIIQNKCLFDNAVVLPPQY